MSCLSLCYNDVVYLSKEQLAVEQVGQLHQALFHCLPPALLNIEVSPERWLSVSREENALGIPSVIKERDAWAHEVTRHVHHLCHQICERVSKGQWSDKDEGVYYTQRLHWDRFMWPPRSLPVNSFLQRSLTLVSRFSSWIWTFL